MPFFKTDDIQAWTGGSWTLMPPNKRPEIRGFTNDSRNVEKDFAFVALKGRRDGHDFAADAVANGASAVIAERELDLAVPVLVVDDSLSALQKIAQFHRRRFENPVVAVSGSCGKTSTKEMLAALAAWKNPLVTEGNLNNQIGVPLTLTKIDLRQNQLAIVEAGVSAPGEMKALADMIRPDIAIITNVGLAHLEYFGEVGNVAKEKSALCAGVDEDGWALFHHNLLSWKAFDELKCKKAVIASADAPDFKADLIFRYSISAASRSATAIDMCVEGGDEFYFEMPNMSQGMTENALLAIACSLMLGAKEENIAAQLEKFSPLPLRGQISKTEKADFYIDCYNANPTSMKDALANFAKLYGEEKPKMFVLGKMAELGLANHRHHREIGLHLPRGNGNKAVLVGENSDIYKNAMIEAGWDESDISIFQNAEEAKSHIEGFEGAVFVKGSRICELEKALPDAALNSLTSATAQQEGEAPLEEDSSPECAGDNNSPQGDSHESTDDSVDEEDEASNDEEELCELDDEEEQIMQEEGDPEPLGGEDDDEDEREKI